MSDADLDYSFTGSNVLDGGAKTSDPDTNNRSILVQLKENIVEMKAKYHTVDHLDLNDKNFTIEQQVANNQWAVGILDGITLILDEKLKEIGDV